ncbi:MAG: Thiazole synthase, partial [uncultured Thermomicrobiales bacterium]
GHDRQPRRRRRPARHRRPHLRQPPDARHRQVPHPRRDPRCAGRLRYRDRHRRPAADRLRRPGQPLDPRGHRPRPLRDPAQHRRLPHRRGGGPHRPHGAGDGSRRLGQAGGDPRPPLPAARPDRHAGSGPNAHFRRVRRAALHRRRPGAGPPAAGDRDGNGDAPRLAHRLRPGAGQPRRDRDHRRAGHRPGRRRRRHWCPFGRGTGDGDRRRRLPRQHRRRARPRPGADGRGDRRGGPGRPQGLPRRPHPPPALCGGQQSFGRCGRGEL